MTEPSYPSLTTMFIYKDKPEAWNMRLVLGVSTVLGIIGGVAAFGLFYFAEQVFYLDRGQAQTMMYLKLSVAGHLTIFLTRTRGAFWSIRPAQSLLQDPTDEMAVETVPSEPLSRPDSLLSAINTGIFDGLYREGPGIFLLSPPVEPCINIEMGSELAADLRI